MPFIVEASTQPEALVAEVLPEAVLPEAALPEAAVPEVQYFLSMLAAFSKAPTADGRTDAVNQFVETVKSNGIQKVVGEQTVPLLQKSFADRGAKEGVLLMLTSIASLGAVALPYLVPAIPVMLEGLGEKQSTVAKAGRSAFAAVKELSKALPSSTKAVLSQLLAAVKLDKTSWQGKFAALSAICELAQSSPLYFNKYLPEIIPIIADRIWDSKPEVRKAASKALTAVCNTITNPDLHPFIPQLVAAIQEPTEVPETVFKLAATTFVTTVEAPSLAIMAPILFRGLAEPQRATLRQAAVIIDNMCKLVEDPVHAEQFLPKLLPGLNRIISTGADPELREVATKAKATLVRVGGGKEDVVIEDEATKSRRAINAAVATLKDIVERIAPGTFVDAATYEFVGSLCAAMDDIREYQDSAWENLSVFFESCTAPAAAAAIYSSINAHYDAINNKRGQKITAADPEEGEELCNCEFSLAYGGMILLNNTNFRLTRGQRYGLCGPNGAGKSTLMRAIANGQLDGFPSKDVLKTVFVEHNLQASDAEKAVLDFVTSDPEFHGKDAKMIADVLSSVGFDKVKQAMPVAALSGGWKMKLELARAMLMQADILLLDEPTNHLDVNNVAWLTKYLNSLSNVTSIIVSHDSGFLDDVCTHIIHYEHLKLKTYKGNLSAFVKVKPEAKSYYTLSTNNIAFKFPEPGFLEGIKSKDKAILKMMRAGYQYPKTPAPTVSDASLQCALNSRVAVVGPNGAGKSTLIKVLTGEVEPTSGEVWKHPALRVAYVAQHAFHHVEQHLDKTPNEYIRWRYQNGEDRELANKITRQLTPEEEKRLQNPIAIDGEKRKIETFMGRRAGKRGFEYEVKWQGKPWDDNTWLSRARLEELGLEKFLKIFDDKEAAREGLYKRPLTSVNVEKHLHDIGLAAEFSSHSRIRGLSGGQKVKVVIGAAMWNNPHMLVLDEPTNYLDRDSLGALADAIKEFGGGVVMVSHHTEFTGALCTETWVLADGKLTVLGAEVPVFIEKIEQKEQLTSVDAFGNTVKVKSTRILSRKEKMQKDKRRAMKIKNGEALSSDDEDN